MPIPLILDTDIGDDVDDVFALLLAALRPELHLLGVTTVHGDTEYKARVARKFLAMIGKDAVPVAAGHRTTLGGRDPGERLSSALGFVGPPGSDEWETLGGGIARAGAVDVLIETVRACPEPPVLVAIGPLTNVGDAFRRAPDLPRRLRSLILMGGRLGTDAEKGEFNFNSDPPATRLVLESGAPLKIGTYDVTSRARIGYAHLPRLRAGSPACRAAAEQLERYMTLKPRADTAMYDPLSLTLAYTGRYLVMRPVALRPSYADRLVHLRVDERAPPTAEVSVDLDAPAFIEHLLASIGA
jgi:inosine-uridine nucleoside N-ribohydrolase